MDQLVSGAWLEDQLESPDLRVLDCTVTMEVRSDGGRVYGTGRAAWEEGHIPGSAHVDLVRELSDVSSPLPFMLPPAEQFSAVMGRLGIGEGSRVILYDSYVNAWAARVWWMLRAFGFDQAAVLNGGWRAWSEDGRTYCGGAIAASSDGFVLSLLGVKDVAIYDGSLSEWAADPALPLVSGS